MRTWPSRRRFMQTALVLLIMVAGGSAEPSTSARRRELQDDDDLMQGDDSACLKGFLDTVREQSSTSIVTTWTAAAIASPCNYTRTLTGITCNNSRVASISLPSAELVGTLPSSLSSCSFLQALDLSSNSLTGSLPASLGALSLLAVLSLSNNQLSGRIPYELATCSSLSSLDLHENQLTGSIPGQLGLLPLKYFDVSDNQLSGLIPTTLSNTSSGSPRFEASCFANNSGLYGFPLNPNPPSFPSYNSPPPRGLRLSAFGILGIALATGLASFVLVYCVANLWLLVKEKHSALLEVAAERERAHQGNKTSNIRDGCSQSEDYVGWKEILNRL